MQVLIIGNPGIGLAAKLIAEELTTKGMSLLGVVVVETPRQEIELPKLDPFLLQRVTDEPVIKPDPVPSWISEKRKKKRK